MNLKRQNYMKTIRSSYRLLFLAATLVFVVSKAGATPDESLWRSVSMLGANDHHYYVLVSERIHPGSYYKYRERILFEKHNIKLNRRIFSAVISDIDYSVIDPEKDTWKAKLTPQKAFDLAGYIAKEKIVPLYPNTLAPGLRVVYKVDGLYLEKKNKSQLLRPLGKSRLVPGEELGVPGVYYKSDYIMLKVRQGDQTIDQDYLEMILPVTKKIYRNVKKQISDKK